MTEFFSKTYRDGFYISPSNFLKKMKYFKSMRASRTLEPYSDCKIAVALKTNSVGRFENRSMTSDKLETLSIPRSCCSGTAETLLGFSVLKILRLCILRHVKSKFRGFGRIPVFVSYGTYFQTKCSSFRVGFQIFQRFYNF